MTKGKKGYTIAEIHDIIGGQMLQGDSMSFISELIIDSRKVNSAERSLFIAIKGERHDGHKFLPFLYEKGVRSFVVSDKSMIPPALKRANVLLADSGLQALQQLATFHRSRFQLPVIGITGSNGKTVVKEWLFQLLASEHSIVRSPKSYNSQVGVPLSIWQMNDECDLCIFEAGISMPGEMIRLQQIIRPSIGIFTNIGEAHNTHFSSLEEKASEKMLLFKDADILIYCADHPIVKKTIPKHIPTFSWSCYDEKAELYIPSFLKTKTSYTIEFIFQKQRYKAILPYTDQASLENAMHCIAACLYLGKDPAMTAQAVSGLETVAMRLQMREGVNRCILINDTYNSDTASLEIALDMLNQQTQHQRKIVFLSDILQSGKKPSTLYGEVAGMLRSYGINKLIGVGENISQFAYLFDLPELHFYPSTDALIADFDTLYFSDEAILVKGARNFEFERIARKLEHRTHRTVMEIDLDAIIHNLNYFRSKLKRDTGVMAMVKAFSYGSGSHEIASILEYNRIEYLAVAYTDEGIALRKAGICTPIMIMSPDREGLSNLQAYKLEPEIGDFHLLNQLIDALNKEQTQHLTPLSVHLKLDTGMHRLGFGIDDLPSLIKILAQCKTLRVRSVFSHLAGSDEAAHDSFTRKQCILFDKMTGMLRKELQTGFLRHILNTQGILRFPEAQYDMVRLGIGLYGIGDPGLLPVSALKSSVIQVRKVNKGETIGYGRRGMAIKDMQIATVAIGYADGLNRTMGNGKGHLIIAGNAVPIIGDVCMDMCMADVTGLHVHPGDDVIVFGPGRNLENYAQELGTIPYEALTSISSRVKRIYYKV